MTPASRSPDGAAAEQAGAGEPLEARSGLAPWIPASLPVPPNPRGLQWLGVVGPGVIVLGASIGSGEFLLGPAVFVRHGLTLLWVSGVAILLQTIFNTELMRYTLATGEPIFTGFMRTRPSSTFWAWFYALLYFLQVGWPAWAGTAAGAIFFLFARRMAGPEEANLVYLIGVSTFLLCVGILLVGRRIERTLEILNWVLVVTILGGFLIFSLVYVPAGTWLAGLLGFFAFDPARSTFDVLPANSDFFLLGALVAYSGSGGVGNLTLTNWARDKGYGMSSRAGYIPAATGEKVKLEHSGFIFKPDAEEMGRFRGWWRVVRADQWAVFFPGALMGMAFPALLYVTFLPAGSDIRGLGIAAALAESMGERAGAVVAGAVAFLGSWILFKTQLDNVDGMTRAITDILWTGSERLRAWRGGDVRAVYYLVLGAIVVWGIIALRLAQPIVLLQIGANIAGVIFIISALHLLYVNCKLLPVELRPPMWRRACLLLMTVFYGFFVTLWLRSMIAGGSAAG